MLNHYNNFTQASAFYLKLIILLADKLTAPVNSKTQAQNYYFMSTKIISSEDWHYRRKISFDNLFNILRVIAIYISFCNQFIARVYAYVGSSHHMTCQVLRSFSVHWVPMGELMATFICLKERANIDIRKKGKKGKGGTEKD